MQAEKLKGRDFWDSNPVGGRWSSYTEKVKWVLNTESFVYELLTEELLKGKQVLDVGCGPGLVIPLVAKYCSSVVGLDYSEASLREGKSGFEELDLSKAHLLCGDAENLPFPDDQFDVVYSIGVLHHTPDTSKATGEIFRVLKPEGRTVIMIYKAYNPKWLAVKFIRALSKAVDRLKGEDFYIANQLRRKYQREQDSHHGTALLELFGCPILKMYSKRKARRMFSRFKNVKLQCYQPGFTRLLDFCAKVLRQPILYKLLRWFDKVTANALGFYLVITAEK